MRFGLRSESVADVNDVASKLITSRRIVFTPSVDLKQELKQTTVNITCYNRNGEIIKRVTSDSGEVEDPENDNENQNQGQTPSTDPGTNPTTGGGGTQSGGTGDEG